MGLRGGPGRLECRSVISQPLSPCTQISVSTNCLLRSSPLTVAFCVNISIAMAVLQPITCGVMQEFTSLGIKVPNPKSLSVVSKIEYTV